MMQKIVGGGTMLLILVALFFYLIFPKKVSDLFSEARCLSDGERAEYVVPENALEHPRITLVVKDNRTGDKVREFKYETLGAGLSKPLEIHKCHFYLIDGKGQDLRKMTFSNDFAYRVLQIDYEGNIQNSVRLSGLDSTGKPRVDYSYNFSVDSSENFISLEKSSLGKPDYALVIKNIETGEDEFELRLDDVLKKYPNAAGSFDVGQWLTRPDGEYLKTMIFDGAREMAYVYVKAGTWETEIYETPSDLIAGVEGAIPPFAPLLAYTDVIVWAGFYEMTQTLIEEQIRSGQKKHLIVANLKTGERKVIETIPIEREHRFRMTWLSDTELEYTMPDGTKKIYHVE